MLDHLLASSVAAPLVTALVTRAVVDRLWPRTAALACTAAAVLVAAASLVSLVALAVPAAVQAWQSAAGGESAQRWREVVAPPWLSWAALAVLVVQVGAVAVVARRQWVGMRSARVEAAALPGTDQVVVVPDERVDAFALPGSPGRIVVTTGMMTALGEAQRAIVLAHERAHLAAGHHRFTFAVRLAAAAHPGLLPVVAMVDYAIERWADEVAASDVRDRRAVARGISAAALLTAPGGAGVRSALHIGSLHIGRLRISGLRVGKLRIGKLHVDDSRRGGRRRGRTRPGPVPRRVAALLIPPPANRLLLSAVPAALAAASCGLAVEAVVDLPLAFLPPKSPR